MILRSLLLLCFCSLLTAQTYDILIRGGQVLDGTGGPARRADVAIRGDKIAAIGDLRNAKAAKVIDATGKYVVPGAIDVHTHMEAGLSDSKRRDATAYLTQGVTTVVAGNCGGSPLNFAETLGGWRKEGIGLNAALLVGHGAVRRSVLGVAQRAPTPEELAKMKGLVEQAMKDGAIGLSSGLFYSPGNFAKTDEVVELAKLAARYNGFYASHVRDESNYSVGVLNAVKEALDIGKQAGLTVEVSHLKALGPDVWGFGPKLTAMIEEARRNGQRVYADQYPYPASGTGLEAAVYPRGAKREDFESLREQVERNIARRGGAKSLVLVAFRPRPEWAGKSLEQIANETGRKPVDVVKLVLDGGGAGVVSFNMSDNDVEHIMKQPWVMTASDGTLHNFGQGVPHPRSYGTYTRKLRNYVLDKQVISMPQAIRAASGLPAEMMRLTDRGLLKEGFYADVVVFDPATVREKATFTQPHQYSEGVELVLVNGKAAIENSKPSGGLFGKVLTHP